MTGPVFTRATVIVRHWPGKDAWRPPRPGRLYSKIAPTLVVIAASDVTADTDRLAFAVAVEVSGASVLGATIVIPDDAPPAVSRMARDFGRKFAVEGLAGPVPWKVETVSTFGDPRKGTLLARAYAPAWRFAGWNVGHVWSLLSDATLQVSCTGRNRGRWRTGPTGSVVHHPNGGITAVSPHRPPWTCGPGPAVGWSLRADVPAARGLGRRENGRPFTGNVLDLRTAAYTLTGEESATPELYGQMLGVDGVVVPTAVTPDEVGLRRMIESVVSLHRLTVALDAKAAQWFTTSRDRSEGRVRLDLARTWSPGGLASGILQRSGVRAPMEVWDLDDEEHGRWAECFHGGWIESDPSIEGRIFQAVSADISSAFPLVAVLLDWWGFMCAERVEMHDDTDAFIAFAHEVRADPGVIDRETLRRFGMDRVSLTLDGTEGAYPIEVDDPTRPDGRNKVVPVDSRGRVMHVMASDVLAAIVRGGTVPAGIVAVDRPVAVGRQSLPRRFLDVVPGLRLDLSTDIVGPIVGYRRKCRAKGDNVTAVLMRVVVNSLVFGQLARMDPDAGIERPGPWCCLPLAAAVTAGTRLLLSLIDRGVTELGGVVAYRATDSSIIPSSIEGRPVTLAGGEVRRELSHVEVGGVLRDLHCRFSLPNWPLFKVARGTADRPLWSVVFGVNRHAEFYLDGDDVTLVNTTQANLAGFYAAPPSMAGVGDEGTYDYVRNGVVDLIRFMLARRADPAALRPLARWDVGQPSPFPAIRRLAVTSPEVLRTLPAALGARMGTRFLTAGGGPDGERNPVVALDPGDDLAGWDTLRWLDRQTGEPVRVTTDGAAGILVDSLQSKVAAWGRPKRPVPVEAVEVGIVQRAGRVSGLLNAKSDGLGDLGARRLRDDDGPAFVVGEVRRLGATTFARTYGVSQRTAERLAGGTPPTARTVDRVRQSLRVLSPPTSRTCALDGCGRPVTGNANAVYCGKRCRDTAHRRTRARTADPYADEVCAGCDCVIWGEPLVDGLCSDCLGESLGGVAS